MDVDQVAEELYALPPEKFTAARNSRAKEAKAAGDKEAAVQIGQLRKPTAVAWLANLLARQRPAEIGDLLDLGASLREATAVLSGPALRELSGQRHRVVYALVQEARSLAAEIGKSISDDVARGLEETLTAALTNDADAQLLRLSRLTEGLSPHGFAGPVPPETATAGTSSPTRDADSDGRPRPASTGAKEPSPADIRARQRARLDRDLRAAQDRARELGEVQEEAAVAFDDAQRVLADTEFVLADLRAELERAEQARDQAQLDSDRAQAAHDSASRAAQTALEHVAEVQSRLDAL